MARGRCLGNRYVGPLTVLLNLRALSNLVDSCLTEKKFCFQCLCFHFPHLCLLSLAPVFLKSKGMCLVLPSCIQTLSPESELVVSFVVVVVVSLFIYFSKLEYSCSVVLY